VGDRAEEATTLNNIGSVYKDLGENQRALEYYKQALSLHRTVDNRDGEANTLNNIGTVHDALGEYKTALEYYKEALPLHQLTGNRDGEATTLHNIGRIYSALGEKHAALEYYKEALSLTRTVGDRAGEAITLNNIGSVYNTLGEWKIALEYYNQALALCQAVGRRAAEAYTLDNLGIIYAQLGEKDTALKYYKQALPLRRALGDRAGEANTMINIGGIYDNLGEKQIALEYYVQALSLTRAVRDHEREATTLNNIGSVYAALGEKQKALNYHKQSITLWRAMGNRVGEAISLNNIGHVYGLGGEYQMALDYYEQALSLRRAVGDRAGEATTLNNIGHIKAALGENQTALEYYKQALPIHQAVGSRLGEAITLHNIGYVYAALGEKQTALEYCNQALLLWRSIRYLDGEAKTLSVIARVERDRGNLIEARVQIEAALGIIDSLRIKVVSPDLKAAFFATVQNLYEFYIDLLMRLHQLHQSEHYEALALHANERARARSLLELLAEAHIDIRQRVDSALVTRELILQQRLNAKAEYQTRLLGREHTEEQATAVQKEIDSLSTEYDQVRSRIRTTNPHYAALTQSQPLSAKEIQQQMIDDSTMLLEYSLGEKRSFLWAVTPAAITSFELPKRAVIDSAARRVYTLLVRDDNVYPQAADSLSQILLGPVAKQLGTKRLLIVADGTLQYIPFGALPIPDTTKKQGKTINPPLLVEHEVISLPSASVLAVLRREQRDKKSAPKTVAVLADPVFSSEDKRFKESKNKDTQKVDAQPADTSETSISALTGKRALREVSEEVGWPPPRLLFSEEEANAIAALVPKGECKKALGFEASRATATSEEMSQYRVVHFSTHAFLNSEHPELSGIVLSLVDEQGKPQDGFLRLHDVYNLNLPTDLVVLSACQTALGKDIRGEGLVGLTRGFMYAGASRIAASLWRVDDNATAKLMKYFYEGMLGKEKLRPAAALRAAQLSMYNERGLEGVYYWASFVIQGEWK
jgi:CHAT domain-containing protein/Tfp pilus assembly protein PilF